jgi:putative glutamine amidotransferase
MSAGVILVATSSEERAGPYVEALRAVGVSEEGLRVVTPSTYKDGGPLSEASGLVLCGGIDVDPARYGEEVLPNGTVEISRERDDMEWDLLAAARDACLPVWGVCRGLQTLNVFLGGSLWQDLPSQLPSGVDHSVNDPLDGLVHTVRVVEKETPLGELLSREVPFVNSRHHQAIKHLAPGFTAVAESLDGVIEAAVLTEEEWWVRGVQWHPENLVAMAQHRALWEDFVRAVAMRSKP